MLSLDLLDRLAAPPGKILGRPEEMDTVTKGGLILPVGYRTHTRSSIVRVLWDSTCTYVRGDRLLLANTAGRRFYLGYTSAEEVEVLVFSPSAVLLKLDQEGVQDAEQSEHYLRNVEGRHDAVPDEDPRWDEGDENALR